jgi:cation diffusion facilitator CzcD-associated flavoprotein CzcO
MKQGTVAIIGAGPYGLSVAAHLKAQGVPVLVFGKPMEFWQKMPPAMYLKSSWSALSISDPAGKYSLSRFGRLAGIPRQEPVPLQTFLKYGRWFQQRVVPDVDQTYVRLLAGDGNGFHLDLADGRGIETSRVIVAAGISSFAYKPDFASHLPPTLVSHSQAYSDFSFFRGKRVVVVGSGQSALECAALLYEAAASVELIARGPVIWIDRRLYRYTGPAKRLFYPPSDVGPPGINWLVSFPLLFRRFSDEARRSLEVRAVRPAGATWLRSRVEGKVNITERTSILNATERGAGIHLELSDGTTREADHLILGTGYQADLQKLNFIDQSILLRVKESNGSPLLNEWFESSVPNLHFVGAPAGYAFGPLCRFVVGSKVSAKQIARRAALRT